MRLIPLLLLLTVQSFGQRDTLLNYSEKVTVTFWKVPGTDSMVMASDTLNLEGSFLKIQVQFTDSMIIDQRDTIRILDWEVKRGDFSVIRLWLQKETGGEPMPIEGLLLRDFLCLDYPEENGVRKSVLYTLVDKQKSVSN